MQTLDRLALPVLLASGSLICGWIPSKTASDLASAHADQLRAVSCQRNLTLALKPGSVPPANADWNRPPARDIPPGLVIQRFPLYPGAVPSTVPMTQDGLFGLDPAYRKVARAEFYVAAGYPTVSAWYQRSLRACGLPVYGTLPLQQHGGPSYGGLDTSTPDGLSRLTMVFRPLPVAATAILYFAQTLDLPPRPRSSFLNGPFTRVAVDFVSVGAVPAFNYRYRFTINWAPTIHRLVEAVNAPTRIWYRSAPPDWSYPPNRLRCPLCARTAAHAGSASEESCNTS